VCLACCFSTKNQWLTGALPVASPSRADEALTQTLKTALALLDVQVLDHLIVTTGEALSMAERGFM
jgi:DNA repair protein RadC